jgi:hypothetical protein
MAAGAPPVDIPPVDEEPLVNPMAQVHQALTLCGVIKNIEHVCIIVFEGINLRLFLGNIIRGSE